MTRTFCVLLFVCVAGCSGSPGAEPSRDAAPGLDSSGSADAMTTDPPSCNPESCEGCCDGDDCVAGTADEACGRSGFVCEVCDPDEECIGGSCVADCGPSNCAGCCDSAGQCVSGNDDGTCGFGGEACAVCDTDQSCSAGTCIDTACAATCGGCCSGENCVDGDADHACGLGGVSCTSCGPGRLCNDGGQCEVDPAALWRVIAVGAEIEVFNPDGGPWDPFGGLPDPRVEITAGGGDQPAAAGSSPRINDTLTPQWGEVVIEGATVATIQEDFQIRLLDYDTFGADDEICAHDVAPAEASFGGPLITISCPSATFNIRIVPQPMP